MACGAQLAMPLDGTLTDLIPALSSSGFVGRQQEIRALYAAVDDALSGRGRLVMLAGEPGIGKTRTAQELASHAEALGAQVFWGWSYEEEGAPPYWPWVQPLRSYCQAVGPDQLQLEIGAGASDIASIVPEVQERLFPFEPSPTLEPEQARFRFFESIANLLRNAARTRPLMIVLEDLHWADRSSLLLLEFLARGIESSPLLIVGTYRDELRRQSPLSQTLGSLIRVPRYLRVQLPGLTNQEVEQLILVISGVAPPASLVETIHRRTDGNPLFVSEVARLLHQGGLGDEPEFVTSIPEGIRDAIGKRLNRLSEGCNQMLSTASVIGREFDLSLLNALNQHPLEEHDQLLGLLEEALEAGLIEEAHRGRSRYRFTHALVQETLAGELTLTRRARLHAQIGESLEVLHEVNTDDHLAKLAYHFARAELVLGPEKLVHYSLIAGEQALATYAWEEALAYFQQGLEAKGVALQGTEPAGDSDQAALLFGLGRSQLAILPPERCHEALICLERSFEYYADAEDVTSAVRVAEYPLPRTSRGPSKVEPRIERGLTLVPSDSIAAGRLLAIYGLEVGRHENDYARAQEAFERGLAIARRVDDIGLETRTLAAWVQVDYFHLHLEECLERSLQVIDLAGHIEDAHSRLIGHLHALQTLIHLGDGYIAQEHLRAGLALAERLNARQDLTNVLRCGVNLYRFLGDWDRARELAERHLTLQQNSVPLFKELASLEYDLGEFQQGEEHLKQMQEIMRGTAPNPGPAYADTSLVSHFASRMTNSTDHLDVAGKAAHVILSSPLANPFWIEIVRTGLALKAVETQDHALAQEQYLSLCGLQGKMRGSFICAERLSGLLAHTMGDLDQAAAHFEEALIFCRSAGYRPDLAWTCHDYAAIMLEGNVPEDRPRAAALLDESLAISTGLGMRPLIGQVTTLQEYLDTQPTPIVKHPSNLTERQWETLQLLAQGMTNREIAQALVLSERTVQRHIADIYGKIGARNRSEATAFAMIHTPSTS